MDVIAARSEVENLLTFVETLFFDDRLYWQVSDLNSKKFELVYLRENDPDCWQINELGSCNIKTSKKCDLETLLLELNVDLKDVEKQIGLSIMMQAVFADLVLKGAEKLFGPESLNACISSAGNFSENLSSLVSHNSQTKDMPPSPLRVIKNSSNKI